MNEYKKLLLEKKGNICVLKFNSPKNLNALSTESARELSAALNEIEEDATVKIIIMTGEGKAFIGGADIKEMCNLNAVEGAAFAFMVSKVITKMEKMSKVFIAAINGYALGAGMELTLGCDIRIFSSNAKTGLPETGLGVIPGSGGTQRLQRLTGVGKANELIFTGDIIDADEALRIGIANKVVAPEELMDAAFEIAEKISRKSPVAVGIAKEAIQIGRELDLDRAIEVEKNLFGLCFSTADQKEGMAAFIEKRDPIFGS